MALPRYLRNSSSSVATSSPSPLFPSPLLGQHQTDPTRNFAYSEQKPCAVFQTRELLTSSLSSSRSNPGRLRDNFGMRQSATKTAEPVRSSMIPLDGMSMDSGRAVRPYVLPLYRPFTFAPPTSDLRNPFASQQTSGTIAYASRLASSMADSTSPLSRLPLQEVHSSSLDRSFASPSPALQSDMVPGLSSSCGDPPSSQRLPYNGLPTIEESYNRIFERSKERLMSSDPFLRHHEQGQRAITPESLPALNLGAGDEDDDEEFCPPPPKRRKRDEDASNLQFAQNSMQKIRNMQVIQKAFNAQSSLFQEDPEKCNAWGRQKAAPHHATPLANPPFASYSSFDRELAKTNRPEASTPQYAYKTTQHHYSPTPTNLNPISQHAAREAPDQFSLAWPYSSSRSSVSPNNLFDSVPYSHRSLYSESPCGADTWSLTRPFNGRGSDSQSELSLAGETLTSERLVQSVFGTHWDGLDFTAAFVQAREMEKARRSQAAMMAATDADFKQFTLGREIQGMTDASCNCTRNSAVEHFDTEVDGEDTGVSVESVNMRDQEADSAARDEQYYCENLEQSTKETDQTRELLKSDEDTDSEEAGLSNELLNPEEETDSEDDSYTSCSNSDSESEDSDSEDSDLENSDLDDSDLETVIRKTVAPTLQAMTKAATQKIVKVMTKAATTRTMNLTTILMPVEHLPVAIPTTTTRTRTTTTWSPMPVPPLCSTRFLRSLRTPNDDGEIEEW